MPAESFMINEEDAPREDPPLLAQLAPLLRARTDLDADDVKYLEEIIGAAVRRFDNERDAKQR
jgi:hypothetical protein